MKFSLKIEMIIISLVFFIFIIKMLKGKKMSIKYSLMWLLIPLFFAVFVLFSDIVINYANKLGFEVLSNFVFFMVIGLLFIICFSLTIIVTYLNQKIITLTQEISMLKKERK